MFPNNLKFSYNWNGKLSTGAFTTLRLFNEKKYVTGFVYRVYLKDEFLGMAKLVGIRRTRLYMLNEFVARLDTGYSLAKCQQIIERMYGKGKDHDLGLYLLVWHKVEPQASINIKNLRSKVDTLSCLLEGANKDLAAIRSRKNIDDELPAT